MRQFRQVFLVLSVLVLGLFALLLNQRKQEAFLARIQAEIGGVDSTVTLVLGTDFLSAPGTVIHLSREQGRKEMLRIARARQVEPGMLFLPELEAWITLTKYKENARDDGRYIDAALIAGRTVEIWHVRNDSVPWVANPLRQQEFSRIWNFPSEASLLQLYAFAADISGSASKIRGVVVGMYGTTEYWSADPTFGKATYQRYALAKEALTLAEQARIASVAELSSVADSHKGFIALRFEPEK